MIIVKGGTGLLAGHLLMELGNAKKPVRVILCRGSYPQKVFYIWEHYHSRPEHLLRTCLKFSNHH